MLPFERIAGRSQFALQPPAKQLYDLRSRPGSPVDQVIAFVGNDGPVERGNELAAVEQVVDEGAPSERNALPGKSSLNGPAVVVGRCPVPASRGLRPDRLEASRPVGALVGLAGFKMKQR